MLPILTVEQMREWEHATWATGQTEQNVIKLVGQRISERLLKLSDPGDEIWIIAGKGHNGDDARAALPGLKERKCSLLEVSNPILGLSEFSTKLQRPGARKPDWIVDGLFGIGLSRPLDDQWKKFIETLNNCGVPIAAVDVPSGLNGNTGHPEGAAVRAEVTFTVGAPKIGFLKGTDYTGRVEVLTDVGFAPNPFDSETEFGWVMQEDFAGLPPRRPAGGNKGTFGHAAIFAGSHGYHGAAVLSSWGALRARPGLVTVYPQENAYVPVASQSQAAMVHPWHARKAHAKNCTALLFGPGLAADDVPDSMKNEMRRNWRSSPLAMVVDASALDWLQTGPTPSNAIRVITPHPGEAGRLLETDAKSIQADRPAALREISQKFGGCCVVLKGQQTLVGQATGTISVNSSGNPWLAQGGSGDLLSGYLTGLLAQPDWQRDPLMAARYAVWQHGATADLLSKTRANWTLAELAQTLGEARAAKFPSAR
jgi:NAD(P)H-hydrate epimerase